MKGSTVDREASDKEKGKDLPTLKDNDFLKDGGRILIGDEAKEKLMETLNADIGVSSIIYYYLLTPNYTQGVSVCIQDVTDLCFYFLVSH